MPNVASITDQIDKICRDRATQWNWPSSNAAAHQRALEKTNVNNKRRRRNLFNARRRSASPEDFRHAPRYVSNVMRFAPKWRTTVVFVDGLQSRDDWTERERHSDAYRSPHDSWRHHTAVNRPRQLRSRRPSVSCHANGSWFSNFNSLSCKKTNQTWIRSKALNHYTCETVIKTFSLVTLMALSNVTSVTANPRPSKPS